MSPKYLLEISSLPEIHSIDAYIFWSLSPSLSLDYFCYPHLPLSLKRTVFCHFLLSLGGFGHLAIIWSAYPHLRHLRGGISVSCLSESPAVRAFYLYFIIFKNICWVVGTSTKSAFRLNKISPLIVSTRTWTVAKI